MEKIWIGEQGSSASLYGSEEKEGYVCLYIHGEGGSPQDVLTEARALLAQGYPVLSADLPESAAPSSLRALYDYAAGRWKHILLLAKGRSVRLCMESLSGTAPEKALFLLPPTGAAKDVDTWSAPTAVLLSSCDRDLDWQSESALWNRFGADLTLSSIRGTAQYTVQDLTALDGWLYLSLLNI